MNKYNEGFDSILMHRSQLTVVLMAIMTLSLLWGSSFIAIKIIVDEVQPLASFGMRFFIAGLLLVSAHYILIHTIYRRSERKDYQIPQFKNRQLWKAGYYQPYSSSWEDREYSQ